MNQYKTALNRIKPKMAAKFEMLLLDFYTAIHSRDGKTFPTLEQADLAIKNLPDDEYVLFKAWKQKNSEWFMAQYFPKLLVCDGARDITDMILFHGGCSGCSSQNDYLIEVRCVKCQYFKADWSKEDLSI